MKTDKLGKKADMETAEDRAETVNLMDPSPTPTCLDQVRFMTQLMQPEQLRERILGWAQCEIHADRLPAKSQRILEAVLYRGQLPRGDVDDLLSVSARQARRVTGALIDHEVLVSESARAPLRLAFPARPASVWMPGLFPPNGR